MLGRLGMRRRISAKRRTQVLNEPSIGCSRALQPACASLVRSALNLQHKAVRRKFIPDTLDSVNLAAGLFKAVALGPKS